MKGKEERYFENNMKTTRAAEGENAGSTTKQENEEWEL